MPYIFTFFIDHNQGFQSILETEQCVAQNANGHRCSRKVCIGINLCWSHLLKYKHLRIKHSTIPNAGKGLFAIDNKQPENAIIFKKGDVIADYIGQTINAQTLRNRYEKHTAPYGIYLKKDTYIDAATERGYASLANQAPQSALKNAKFVPNFRLNPQRVQLKATKEIRNGNDILTSYGRSYKFNEEYETKYVRGKYSYERHFIKKRKQGGKIFFLIKGSA